MLCEKCGKYNATTHIRTVVNGVVTEKNLCAYCAAGDGCVSVPGGGFGVNGFAQLLASMLGDSLSVSPDKSDLRCPCCNSSFSDIAESGNAGCSECYRTFYRQLLPYINRIHGSTVHSGKIPNKAPLTVRVEEDTVDSLRMKLNELVSKEKYEEAAVIRDKIKKLEEEENK